MSPKSTTSNSSTEEIIKQAARTVFLKKGFAATRTRDIAEASGENLALINYYFKSKENLYRMIMLETMGAFLNTMIPIVNDEKSNVYEKIELMVANYITLFTKQPDIPLFVLNEINRNPENFMQKTAVKEKMMNSIFFNQLAEKLKQTGQSMSPFHIFMNMMSMIIFPFVASPLIKGFHGSSDEQMNAMIQERKELIPIWMKSILEG